MSDRSAALLALLNANESYIGLLTSETSEMQSRSGSYARQRVPAGAWRLSDAGVTTDAVRFEGFISTAPAMSVLVALGAASSALFVLPLGSGGPRAFLTEADSLDVTATLTLEDA